ncbi:MAG: metallophosphoesterase family protein, partial [Candidatus Bathyarchaeia archaeon]
RSAEHEGMDIRGNFAEIQVDDTKIVLLHGHEDELLKALINSQSFSVVVHGHTHKAEIYRKGKTLIINPGEVCGYLTGNSTVAILDTDRLEAKIIEIR